MARYAELVYSDSRCYTLRALKIGERRISWKVEISPVV